MLLIFETALWNKKQGFKYFHIGGGYKNGDSLFTFKKRFNPTGVAHFYVGKIVRDQNIYHKLVKRWKQKNGHRPYNPDYFPIYRQR